MIGYAAPRGHLLPASDQQAKQVLQQVNWSRLHFKNLHLTDDSSRLSTRLPIGLCRCHKLDGWHHLQAVLSAECQITKRGAGLE